MTDVNVALIGHAFMGRAHSKGYRQVGPFFTAAPAGHPIGYEHTFTHTFYDLLEAMASGTPPSPTFEDGSRHQRVLEAIEQSSERRTWVRVGEAS